MATELNSIYFQNLPIGAHCRFNTRVSTEIASSPSQVVTILGQLPTEFNKLLAEERAIEDWVKKSVLTDLIRTADRRMDRAFTALKLQTHTQEYSTSAAIAEAAHRVYLMLTSYGKVIRKPYEDQAGDIQSILRQFYSGGAYNADAATLGLSAMISELQTALTLFDQLLKQRDERSLQKPDKTFRELRRLIEPVYRRMEKIINANAIAGASTASFIAIIDHLNPEIDRLNAEFHRVLRDIARAEPESIPPQIYTGRAITPLTKVLYVTTNNGTIQLELGKDFNLSFKNNVEVGNAECTIHGKGAYKGRKTVTFIIMRAV